MSIVSDMIVTVVLNVREDLQSLVHLVVYNIQASKIVSCIKQEDKFVPKVDVMD